MRKINDSTEDFRQDVGRPKDPNGKQSGNYKS